MSRKYHLSYDTINCENDFKDYIDAKNYLFCVLGQTPLISVSSPNESSLIIEYNKEQKTLFRYLQNNLSKYFYFTISLVALSPITGKHYMRNNKNIILNAHTKVLMENLKCSSERMKQITPYLG